MTAKESKVAAFYVQPHLVSICKKIGHVQKEHRVVVATEKTGSHTVPLYEESALHAAESLLAEAESENQTILVNAVAWMDLANEREKTIAALQSRLDAVVGLADQWEKLAETHGVRMFSGNDHWLFANELRAALGGESPGNDEELK